MLADPSPVMKRKCESVSPVLSPVGGCDSRVAENTEYLAELQALVHAEGLSSNVCFLTSVSDDLKAKLLTACLAVVYTPSVRNEEFLSARVDVS